MKDHRFFIQIIIGISIIAFILNKLNINDIMDVLKKTELLYFITACISYLFLNFVLAYRLSFLLKKIGYDLKYINVFFAHTGGMIAGDITPGRSGYFLTPSILKKKSGIPLTEGMACIFAPQGIEFILKVAGAVAAILYISSFSNISSNFIISAMTGSALLLIVGIFMLVISWHNEKLSSKFLNRLPFFNNFTQNLSLFKERSILIKENLNTILLMYMIGWFFAALHWYFLARSIGISISFPAIFILHPLITILMFVPISPAGLGLMETGVIVVFSFFSIPSVTAMAFSLLVRISILLVDMVGLRTVIKASR